MARVNGKLTNNGQAVGAAEIEFQSQSNASDVFFGSLTADGVYHVDDSRLGGLPPGKYTVTITYYTKLDGTALPPDEQGRAMIEDGRARRMVVTFEKDLSPGSTKLDFELKEGKVQADPALL